MKKIYALVDYKYVFGSKWKAKPYRSGFEKNLLNKYMQEYGFQIEYIKFNEVDFRETWKDKIVIYTSSEVAGLQYKSFIEDIVLGLENKGAIVIPSFNFLRAHHNKTFMEILGSIKLGEELSGNRSNYYGTLEELLEKMQNGVINYPCVIKTASGTMSKGVFLARKETELLKHVKKITRSRNIKSEFRDFIRRIKHMGYKKESKYQHKFITQSYIPNLGNDWKILIFGDHYYIMRRDIKKHDFRASGSHLNYRGGTKAEFPLHMLNYVEKIYNLLNTPHLSLDFAYDGKRGYVIEFQSLYFGLSTMEYSDGYYVKENSDWIFIKATLGQEEEYVRGIVKFIKKNLY